MTAPESSNPLASEYDRARAEFEYIHSCKPTEPEHHGWIAGYCAALRDARLADETEPVQAKLTLNPDALISTTRCNYCMGTRYVTVQRSVVPLTSRVGSGPVFVSEPCPMCNAEPL